MTFLGHTTIGSISYYHNHPVISLYKCWCRRGCDDNMTELGNVDVPYSMAQQVSQHHSIVPRLSTPLYVWFGIDVEDTDSQDCK